MPKSFVTTAYVEKLTRTKPFNRGLTEKVCVSTNLTDRILNRSRYAQTYMYTSGKMMILDVIMARPRHFQLCETDVNWICTSP